MPPAEPVTVEPMPPAEPVTVEPMPPAGSMSPTEVAASYLESFAGGDPVAIAAHVRDDFSNEHTSALGLPSQGKDEYLARLGGFLEAFVGLTFEIEEIIASGDRVAAAYTMRARSDGTPIEIRGVMRMTIRDGLITHRTDYFDSLTFLRQTGQA